MTSLTDGADHLARIITWSHRTRIKIFSSETGGPPDLTGLAAFCCLLEAVRDAPVMFWGIAVWGSRPWWKLNYPMRPNTVDNMPRPQFMGLGDTCWCSKRSC